MYREARYDVMVDFDDTLAEFKYPDLGRPREGAREFLQDLANLGYRIIIYTARMSPEYRTWSERQSVLYKLEQWLERHDMPYDEVDRGDSGKRVAMAYIDDRAAEAGPGVSWETTLARLAHIREREDARWAAQK